MKIGILFPDLPLKTGWIFPHEGVDVPLTDYHDDLVTQPQIESLMTAMPWETMSTNSGLAISFHTDVGGRFRLFLEAYRLFEIKRRMALWEGTHQFPIPRPRIAKSAWLADFNKKRGNRRSHTGGDSKKILVIFIFTMQDGWCVIPSRELGGSEPATLLDALDECRTADPWRNHFRDAPLLIRSLVWRASSSVPGRLGPAAQLMILTMGPKEGLDLLTRTWILPPSLRSGTRQRLAPIFLLVPPLDLVAFCKS
ncbi:hypothetical protein PC119_g16676 [Phytophthora cactorum]|nr:hypothetical protein PC119_g16676 [Phytophthora cactorum]